MPYPDSQTLIQGLDVSRETIQSLESFAKDLERWSRAINLVGHATLNDSWRRHILDSAQLLRLTGGDPGEWCDLGSGGGLPGLVVAILMKERFPHAQTTLMESDARKAAFLKTIVRKHDLNARVLVERIELATPQNSRVISARALAPLSSLLVHVRRHICVGGVALLHKGKNFQQEVEEALRSWHFNLDVVDSLIDRDAKILKISALEPKVEKQ